MLIYYIIKSAINFLKKFLNIRFFTGIVPSPLCLIWTFSYRFIPWEILLSLYHFYSDLLPTKSIYTWKANNIHKKIVKWYHELFWRFPKLWQVVLKLLCNEISYRFHFFFNLLNIIAIISLIVNHGVSVSNVY